MRQTGEKVFVVLKVDHEKKLMVIVNRSVDHPMLPANSKYVRVNTYMSKMVIKPHTSFDEVGTVFSYSHCTPVAINGLGLRD